MSDNNGKATTAIATDSSGKMVERPVVVRNTSDWQRLKVDKLMKNPERAVIIPERPKDKSMPSVPDFVRNVMGSSAGAGSGEFHVYRHLRRKEYARQKYIQEKSEKERLNDEYHERIENNRLIAEEKTAKKRAKRLKKKLKWKQNQQLKSKYPPTTEPTAPNNKSSSDSEHSRSRSRSRSPIDKN